MPRSIPNLPFCRRACTWPNDRRGRRSGRGRRCRSDWFWTRGRGGRASCGSWRTRPGWNAEAGEQRWRCPRRPRAPRRRRNRMPASLAAHHPASAPTRRATTIPPRASRTEPAAATTTTSDPTRKKIGRASSAIASAPNAVASERGNTASNAPENPPKTTPRTRISKRSVASRTIATFPRRSRWGRTRERAAREGPAASIRGCTPRAPDCRRDLERRTSTTRIPNPCSIGREGRRARAFIGPRGMLGWKMRMRSWRG
mmetsp:Transcript_24951/g.32024  ORF Transcript_24951/g.32024 Transcript_24951/m.32024 type:complete len:257 (+) Transcript_24951:394-1164(+)